VSRDGFEIGGYLVDVRETGSWDAIAGLLEFLQTDHHDLFHRLMAGCRALSSSRPETDGFHALLTDRAQDMFDLAIARDERREQQGYLTPAESRAFLQMAREVRLTGDAPPPLDVIATAYFRAFGAPTAAEDVDTMQELSPAAHEVEIATAGVVELLRDAGVINDQPRALLPAPNEKDEKASLGRLQAYLSQTADSGNELAFLANAIVGGCSVQGRPFTEREAADVAMATCNLGLENWPAGWPPPADLVSAFTIGWKMLYDDIVMYTAQCLIDVLGQIRIDDGEIQDGLDELRLDLIRGRQNGTPWIVADALDAIATLDLVAWAGLVGLLGECPIIHDAIRATRDRRVRSVSPTGFEFISDNRHVAIVREFGQSLGEMLAS
jgi:hypothetical protein